MRTEWLWIAGLSTVLCTACGSTETDGGEPAIAHDRGPGSEGTAVAPEAAPRPLVRRTDLNPTLLEIARREDAKERADGRLAAWLADDPDPAVRRAAAMALGHIRNPEDAPALVAAYGDTDIDVATAAIFATGLLQDAERKAPASEALRVLLAHDDARIRAAAVETLGRIGDPTTAEAVHALIADPDPRVRGEAALAAWRLVAGAPKILELDDHPTVEAEKARADALAIRDRVYVVTMPLARAAAAEAAPTARWQMIFAVAALRRPTAKPAPPTLLDAERAELGELVQGWLGVDDPIARGYAALAAGRVLGEDSGAVLAPVLADPDWTVRIWALRAVQDAKATGVLTAIRGAAAGDPHPLVRAAALTALGARKDGGALDAVAQAMDSDSPSVRRAALGVWAALQGPAALDRLRPYCTHTDPWTRTAAIAAVAATVTEEAPEDHLAAVTALLGERFGAGDRREQAAVLEAAGELPLPVACDLAERGLRVDALEVRGTACDLIKTRAEAILEAGRDLGPALQMAWERSQGPDNYELRQLVLDALVALQDDRAEGLLRTALTDPSHHVREAARAGLKELSGEIVVVLDEAPEPPAPGRPDAVDARALDLPHRLRITTSKGEMVCELYPEDAPLHVLNVVRLARRSFYDGLPFHRVVPGFVIQGGCPRGTGWGDPGYRLANEFNARRFVHGTLGMPRTADPDTGGCQLFINHLPTPHLDGLYTVFGRVIEGLAVVDRIEVGDTILRVRDE